MLCLRRRLCCRNCRAARWSGPGRGRSEHDHAVDILAEGDLIFGTVAIPRTAECTYTLNPRSEASATDRDECRFLGGEPLAGEFSVSCGAGQMVTFEAIYTSTAPSGASFRAGAAPMEIDGLGAGDVVQIRACDKDGFSEVRFGGELIVTPQAPDGFSGEVGTIRLEASY